MSRACNAFFLLEIFGEHHQTIRRWKVGKMCKSLFRLSSECTKTAHRRSLTISTADEGVAGSSAARTIFTHSLRRRNRGSLAIFFAEEIAHLSRAAKRGRFKRGGFPIWTCPSFVVLFCPLGLSRFFWDFPDLLGDGPGIFQIRPFSLSRPIKSTYEEQSRKGPRHNLDLSRKKWETPRVWKPPGLASPKSWGLKNRAIFRAISVHSDCRHCIND